MTGIIQLLVSRIIYYWFFKEAVGNLPTMAILFFGTGAVGFVLVYAFSKEGSMYISIAAHLGWELAQPLIFSDSPIGNFIFIPVVSKEQITISYFTFFSVLLLLMIITAGANYLLLKKQVQKVIPEQGEPAKPGFI